jgi:hypothetical protein
VFIGGSQEGGDQDCATVPMCGDIEVEGGVVHSERHLRRDPQTRYSVGVVIQQIMTAMFE